MLAVALVAAPSLSAKKDLEIALPEGQRIGLQRICVGEETDPFTSRRFTMGDPGGGFKEFPTAISVGGNFVVEQGGQREWCYYMSATEVTVGQFQSVTNGPSPPEGEEAYPIRNLSWFEALDFIDRLNQWVYAHGLDQMPRYGEAVGFFRLPTEQEWEFAARGGAVVAADYFDKRTPYPPGRLSRYEWFSGPGSSHNKVRKVGLLKPNPLGLYDMLGNVAEMTMSLYQVEYYQGRIGGFVARGNHYLIAEKHLRSSARSEQPFYSSQPNGAMQPNRQATLGFRVVISSILYSDHQAVKEMADAWKTYRGSQGANLPAAVSMAPINQQVNVEFGDAADHITRLKALLAKGTGGKDALLREVGFIEAAMAKTRQIRDQAARDSAYAWVLIAGERALNVRRQEKNIALYEKLQRIAVDSGDQTKAKNYRQRLQEVQQNVEVSLSGYSTSLRQLAKLDKEIIDSAMAKYNNYLLKRNAANQVQMLPILHRHIRGYLKDQRVDRQQWHEDLIVE